MTNNIINGVFDKKQDNEQESSNREAINIAIGAIEAGSPEKGVKYIEKKINKAKKSKKIKTVLLCIVSIIPFFLIGVVLSLLLAIIVAVVLPISLALLILLPIICIIAGVYDIISNAIKDFKNINNLESDSKIIFYNTINGIDNDED